jgi:hypothetical protein
MKTKNGHNGTPIFFEKITLPPALSNAGRTLTDLQPMESQEKCHAQFSTRSAIHFTVGFRGFVEWAAPTTPPGFVTRFC